MEEEREAGGVAALTGGRCRGGEEGGLTGVWTTNWMDKVSLGELTEEPVDFGKLGSRIVNGELLVDWSLAFFFFCGWLSLFGFFFWAFLCLFGLGDLSRSTVGLDGEETEDKEEGGGLEGGGEEGCSEAATSARTSKRLEQDTGG